MDLESYERFKFGLAQIIPSAELIAVERVKDSNKKWQVENPWRVYRPTWSRIALRLRLRDASIVGSPP